MGCTKTCVPAELVIINSSYMCFIRHSYISSFSWMIRAYKTNVGGVRLGVKHVVYGKFVIWKIRLWEFGEWGKMWEISERGD